MGALRGEHVNIPVEVIQASEAAGELRLVRAWLVVRAADPDGTGHVRRAALLHLLQALGLRRSATHSILKELEEAGIGRRTATCFGDPVFLLCSVETLMRRYGVRRSTADVLVPVRLIVARSYRRRLLAMARVRWQHHPMARGTVARLTGASASSQRRAERDLGAVSHQNVRSLGSPDLDRGVVLAADCPGTFQWRGELFRRLPNTTEFPGVQVVRRRRHCPGSSAGQETAKRRRYLDGKAARRDAWIHPETREVERQLRSIPGLHRIGAGRCRLWSEAS